METADGTDEQEELTWRRLLIRTGKQWWRPLLQVPFTLFFVFMAGRLVARGPTGLELAVTWACFVLFTLATLVHLASTVVMFQDQHNN